MLRGGHRARVLQSTWMSKPDEASVLKNRQPARAEAGVGRGAAGTRAINTCSRTSTPREDPPRRLRRLRILHPLLDDLETVIAADPGQPQVRLDGDEPRETAERCELKEKQAVARTRCRRRRLSRSPSGTGRRGMQSAPPGPKHLLIVFVRRLAVEVRAPISAASELRGTHESAGVAMAKSAEPTGRPRIPRSNPSFSNGFWISGLAQTGRSRRRTLRAVLPAWPRPAAAARRTRRPAPGGGCRARASRSWSEPPLLRQQCAGEEVQGVTHAPSSFGACLHRERRLSAG